MLSLISASDKLYRFIKQRYAEFGFRLGQLHITYYNCTAPDSQCGKSLIKATFHLTIYMRGQRATGKIQRNNYHHGSYEPSLCLSQFQLGTSPPGNPRGLAQKHCPEGRDLTFESCPGAGNSTRAGILWKFKVKHWLYQ